MEWFIGEGPYMRVQRQRLGSWDEHWQSRRQP